MEEVNIELTEYSYHCSDGCCFNYGVRTVVNGEQLPIENEDLETQIRQILEHLGFKVNIVTNSDHE